MCANYTPARGERLAAQFDVDPREYVFKPEVYPGAFAPIVRRASTDQLEVVSAMFGMVPHWADIKLARQTYNSRTETTATKPSFRNAWKRRQFCIVPAESIYEPCYETGVAVRWRIADREGAPLGVAGIWEVRASDDAQPALVSFSMLTINADDHALMRRFHQPDHEKRSVILLRTDQYAAWLDASLEDAPKFFSTLPSAALMAEPAPRGPGASASIPRQERT